jgi:hypothetical protein
MSIAVDISLGFDNHGQPTWSSTPNPVVVKGPNQTLVFNLLAPSPWVYATNEALTITGPDADTEFCCYERISDTKLSVEDADDKKNNYEYTVTVHNPSTGQTLRYDPPIENDN